MANINNSIWRFCGTALSIMVLNILVTGCIEPVPIEEQIIGSWQIDSIYDFHNGFTFTNRNPYPKEVHEYRTDQTVLRKGMGEQFVYRYTCKDSILTLMSDAGTLNGEFTIMLVNTDQLALRKDKRSMFPGKNDVRYEVRYFSRIDSVSPIR